MLRISMIALGCLIFAGMATAAKAENQPLYVWADSLTLHAAPSFSASTVAELAYGTAVEPLSARDPLMSGGGVYPPMHEDAPGPLAKPPSEPQLHGFSLHGHWLKLRSRGNPAREGFAFDTYLLPLPAPRCEPGRSSCDPVTALGWALCPDKATVCESIEDYSARVFGERAQAGTVQSDGVQPAEPSQQASTQGDDADAPVKIERRYDRGVVVYSENVFDGDLQGKRWTLPMLHSIDQAYVVMRRFFGSCRYLNVYEPPREVDLQGCGKIENVTIVLSTGKDGAVIDWGYMD
jgi:hypothetical protein